jgi:alcohol dehydrogenase class IV
MAGTLFITPREIFYGEGALESLTNVSGKRALIVTDPIIRDLGLVEKVEQIERNQGLETAVYDQVEPDPSRDTVGKIFSLAQEFQPDIFIGLGGGSSIDAGKAAWLLYEQPDLAKLSVTEVVQKASQYELRQKARYVAVPTTSGTGSETTRVAVVTDRSITPPFKAPWNSPHLVPDVAIVDPELTVSMPPEVTANTGFDALIHAIECYVLTVPTDMVDALALYAARTICEWLPQAVADGNSIQAREKMHLASLQAGMAFTNGRLGLVHGLAHMIGGEFGIPHGRANAFMLCPVFAFWFPTHRARLASLASALGIEGKDDVDKTQNLFDFLDRLKQRVGIPTSIKESSMAEDHFFSQVEALVASFMNWIEGVPVEARRTAGMPVESEEVTELYRHAWNGTRADLGGG